VSARRVALVVGTLVLGARLDVAAADRREASVHAHLVGAFLNAGDEASVNGGRGSGPLGGLAVRASFATRNSYQYDVALSLLAGRASFDQGVFTPMGMPSRTGPFTVATQAARLDGGVTVRLGVRWIPTVRVAAGLQARHRGAPVVTVGGIEINESMTGRSADLQLDAVGVADVGLDFRVNRRVIVGAAAGASYAVPIGGEAFRTVEVTAHAAYYWYPR
jgi:hypothetical protein